MKLRPLYDDEMIRELAQDLSEVIILAEHPTRVQYGYERAARKLYAAGWRRENHFASGAGGHE
jgi:hypothetical protein